MYNIEFTQDILDNAGYVQVTDDPVKPLRNQDRNSLSFLVFYMTYTRAGRDLWKNNSPYQSNTTPADAKAALMTALNQQFPLIPAAEREALIDAHIAASLYQQATIGGNLDAAQAANQQTIYKQKMGYICAQLYEYSLSHDFSMSW